jgi:hypothetical protein
LLKNVNGPDVLSEGSPSGEEGDEGASQSKSLSYTYVAGRIYYDHKGSGRWVYEAFNHCFSADRFPEADLPSTLASIYQRSEQELINQAAEIREARQTVI